MSIKEIAKRTGVSVSTVSRALNNYTDVNPETRKKIFSVAQELNYYPSAVARSLVMKKTNIIGLFFGDQVNSNFDEYLDEINAVRSVAGNSGYDLLVFANINKEHATYTTLCRERGVDGVFLILNREEKKKTDQINELQQSGIPCVTVNFHLEGDRCSYVESNNRQGTKDAVSHLIDLGHRRIGFIGGDTYGKAGVDRVNGYRDALDEAGIPFDPDLVDFGYFTESGAVEAAARLFKRSKNISALFIASDSMAFTVIKTLKERGLKVPEDVSIVGWGDHKESARFDPPLTTIRLERYEQGRLATELLIQMIEDVHCKPKLITLPCRLITRHSTAPRNG
ncbi:MAG: hypothetical protein K0S39_3361 [Paenibacillus sp.]|jgi:DNA-binding LacI/PurR family transcriptional regulator|nr:hypothetical protein [Paenibacillus sp.]